LPEPHEDGTPIDPSELPQSLPGYLIHLTGELTLDGNVIAEGGNFTMGSELGMEAGYLSADNQSYVSSNKLIAGEYHIIGVDFQGISRSEITILRDKFENTTSKLENQNFVGLGKHDLIGDFLYSAALAYFSLNDQQNEVAAKSTGMVYYRQPSYGLFSTSIQTSYSYGVPKNISFSGLLIDIDFSLSSIIDKKNDTQAAVFFNESSGRRLSKMEHLIPERLFSNENNSGEAVSAVKALSIALQEGQKIYLLTENNLNAILPTLDIESEVKEDIRNSVTAGLEVTVSGKNIQIHGWKGVGYIIIDPDTGAGAYKISGGYNGGFYGGAAFSAIINILIVSIVFFPNPIFLAILAGVILAAISTFFIYAELYDNDTQACFITGFDTVFYISPFILSRLKHSKFKIAAGIISAIDGLLLFFTDGNDIYNCTLES